MKYKIIWHDCEDDRTGSEFSVEAPNPTDAYFKAIETIKGYSQYLNDHFCGIDLECLVDEDGKFLHPDIFLNKKKSGKATAGAASIWEKIFDRYKEVSFFPSPAYKSVMDRPAGSITNVREIPDGQNTIFEDWEFVTYFYDFSTADLELLSASGDIKPRKLGLYTGQCEHESEVIEKTNGLLVYRSRFDKILIGEKLEQLVKGQKKVTHIACAEEVYGGDTHYSVWRDYQKAEIYEVRKNEK